MEESLDVGCGSTKRASIGVDINRICKPDVVADAGTLPFRDKTFDRVISVQCLEHLWKPHLIPMEAVMSCLTEFRRVMKRGGVLDLTMPNFAGLSTLIKWLIHRGEGMMGMHGQEGYFLLGSHVDIHQVHHVLFTHKNLKIALKQSGFTNIKFLSTSINSDLSAERSEYSSLRPDMILLE